MRPAAAGPAPAAARPRTSRAAGPARCLRASPVANASRKVKRYRTRFGTGRVWVRFPAGTTATFGGTLGFSPGVTSPSSSDCSAMSTRCSAGSAHSAARASSPRPSAPAGGCSSSRRSICAHRRSSRVRAGWRPGPVLVLRAACDSVLAMAAAWEGRRGPGGTAEQVTGLRCAAHACHSSCRAPQPSSSPSPRRCAAQPSRARRAGDAAAAGRRSSSRQPRHAPPTA
jgi:hypothetical protein